MDLPVAPMGRRFLAQFVDLGVVSALSYAVAFVWVFLAAGVMGGAGITGLLDGLRDGQRGGDPAAFLASPAAMGLLLCLLALALAVMTVFHGYFVFHESRTGATPGKRIFGLKVVSADERPLTPRRCLVREVLRDLDLLLLPLSVICMALTPRKQRLGDLAARTFVAYSRREEAERESMYLAPGEYERLGERIRVAPVPERARRGFLEFAYPTFVLRARAASPEELERWVPLLDEYAPGWRGAFPDPGAALLYLAEACFRQANAAH